MDKLLELIDVDLYDKLIEALGEKAEGFIADFENGVISEDDVFAKLEELGLHEEETVEEVVETVEEDKVEDVVEVDKVEDIAKAVELVLGTNWSEDIDSIPYEPLRGFIKGLKEIGDKASWNAKYELEILKEAIKQNMYDIEDSLKYITVNDIGLDGDGKVTGLNDKFNELKKMKPHLFKQSEVTSGTNPIDSGFEPVDNKIDIKPTSYAQALELSKLIKQ